MRRELQPNRPEFAALRGKTGAEQVSVLAETFGAGDRSMAKRYLAVLGRLFGAGDNAFGVGLSANTRQAYFYAIAEFFEWVARHRKRVVPPHEVTREDALRYVDWLSNRSFTLAPERIVEPERRAIYEIVSAISSGTIHDIEARMSPELRGLFSLSDDELQTRQQELEQTGNPAGLNAKDRFNWWQLHFLLGRMVLHDLIARKPTMEELRKDYPQAGITQFLIPKDLNWFRRFLAGKSEDGGPLIPLYDAFRYMPPAADGVKRTTAAARVSALSSFWKALMQGENVSGGEPLIRYNIWEELRKDIGRNLADDRRQAAEKQRIDPQVVARFVRYVIALRPTKLTDFRDRAMVLLMTLTGIRVSEVTQLRRSKPNRPDQWLGYLDAQNRTLVIRRKGAKWQTLPYPPLALAALAEFQTELKREAEQPEVTTMTAWSRDMLLPDAPLFPPVRLWGANSPGEYEEYRPNPLDRRRGLSRHGVYAALRRVGKDAGLTDDENDQIHPHGLRHFAATAMERGGKDLREVQAILGHKSITTTEGYLEDITDQELLAGQDEVLRHLSTIIGDTPLVAEDVVEAEAIEVPEQEDAGADDDALPERTEGGDAPEAERDEAHRPGAAAEGDDEETHGGAEEDAPGGAPRDEIMNPAATHTAPLPPPIRDVPTVQSTAEGVVVSDYDEVSTVFVKAGNDVEPVTPETEDGEPVPTRDMQLVGGVSAGSPEWTYRVADEARDQVRSLIRDRVLRSEPGTSAAKKRALSKSIEQTKRSLLAVGVERVAYTETATRKQLGEVNRGLASHGALRQSKGGNDLFQKNRFLAEHYHPWPERFGIGELSLLVWWTAGRPYDDFATAEQPEGGALSFSPPVPVLSRAQADGTTKQGMRFLEAIDDLHEAFVHGDPKSEIVPDASRMSGLIQWWQFLAYNAKRLDVELRMVRHKSVWGGWNEQLKLGKRLREHQYEFIVRWLQYNSHTFFTTSAALARVGLVGGSKATAAEAGATEWSVQSMQKASLDAVSLVADLPDWLADEDPVHAIYEQSTSDWRDFVAWLESNVGYKMTTTRSKAVSAAEKKTTESIKAERAKWMTIIYEEVFREHSDAIKQKMEGDPSAMELFGETLAAYNGLVVANGLTPIADGKRFLLSERAQLDAWIDMNFPLSEGEASDQNLVGRRNTVLDPRFIRIDLDAHTVRHTDEYKDEFAERFKRDSELVARRALRGLWEYRKAAEKELPNQQIQQVVQTYMTWIIPAPGDMDRIMAERGFRAVPGDTRAGRLKYIQQQTKAAQALFYVAGEDDPDDVANLTPDEQQAVFAAFGLTDEASQAEAALATQMAVAFGIDKTVRMAAVEDEMNQALSEARRARAERLSTDDPVKKELLEAKELEERERLRKLEVEHAVDIDALQAAVERYEEQRRGAEATEEFSEATVLPSGEQAWKVEAMRSVAAARAGLEEGAGASQRTIQVGRRPKAEPLVENGILGRRRRSVSERLVPNAPGRRVRFLRDEGPVRTVHRVRLSTDYAPNPNQELWVSDGYLADAMALVRASQEMLPSPVWLITAALLG